VVELQIVRFTSGRSVHQRTEDETWRSAPPQLSAIAYANARTSCNSKRNVHTSNWRNNS